MANQASVGHWLRRGTRSLETSEALDGLADALQPLAGLVTSNPTARDALRGHWLGHSFHPLATDFPLGAWLSASLLDLVGGQQARRPAQKLIAFGLLAALPTVASGLAEWNETDGEPRRVGVVHAATNATASLLYAASLLSRLTGRQRPGVALGVAGGVLATAGSYLGGHLSLVRGVGVDASGR